eukprot:TRINITY_DN55548_c0_g1_i1.p1 TRINITY_DN55548_c0_g1~~TRINITY_DN55548_c0_g1_i1.p1  ORF type:complete len:232 (-),score=26.30 TRINITY_DN55548_c0_g1_i1:77-772(-)
MLRFLAVYWPALMALFTWFFMCIIDPSPKDLWPPTFDLSGAQARVVLTSPFFLAVALPMVAGLFGIGIYCKRAKISTAEQASMVWWLCCMFWFNTGCDVLSGFFQVMPMLTDIYIRMTPSHTSPRWHESRAHLDAGYALELLVQVPLSAWTLWLYFRRDPARHIFETFLLGIQFAGTVMYYAPGLARGEAASWLSYLDRLLGSAWLIYPALLCHRHMVAARPKRSSGKKKN